MKGGLWLCVLGYKVIRSKVLSMTVLDEFSGVIWVLKCLKCAFTNAFHKGRTSKSCESVAIC